MHFRDAKTTVQIEIKPKQLEYFELLENHQNRVDRTVFVEYFRTPPYVLLD